MAGGVKIHGGDKLTKLLKTLPAEMTAEVRATIKKSADALAEEIRRRAPEDTGALRKAIRVRISQKGLRARVGIFGAKATRIAGAAVGLMMKRGLSKRQASRVASQLSRTPFYARWVEFGTTKMRPRPFFYSTYRAKRRAILGNITQAALGAIKKAE